MSSQHLVWLVGGLAGLAAAQAIILVRALRSDGEHLGARFKSLVGARSGALAGFSLLGIVAGVVIGIGLSEDTVQQPSPLWAVAICCFAGASLLAWFGRSARRVVDDSASH